MPLQALVFDIQGTAVDFHNPLMRAGADTNARNRIELDWAGLGREWRALYREAMDAIIAGQRPWTRVDRIYRETLDVLLARHADGARLDAGERDRLNTVWSRLDPWPDSVEGLQRLKARYTTAALSNAGMAAVVAVVKHAGLPLDAILTAELARSYKPDPRVYRLAVDYLGFAGGEIMMVACHKYDLGAARAVGLQTAFVARPLEFGPDGTPDISPDPDATINARDFIDLAEQLGA